MTWTIVILAYAAYLAGVAWLRPTSWTARVATLAGLVGAAALQQAPWATAGPWLRGVLALVSLVAAYQLAGLLFAGPAPWLERRLAAGDAWLARRLGVPSLKVTPGLLASLLETSYLLVYPMLPLGAAALYLGGAGAYDDAYWTAVLASGVACYGALPWLPSRTPRALEPDAPTQGEWTRRANLAVLRRPSTGVNTVPSGHAATSTAAALVVAAHVASPVVAAGFVALAATIAVATVTGRYHYTADTLAGVLVGALAGALCI